MTEQEWNEIVQKNYSEFKKEENDKKNKLAQQREQMKAELLQQVAVQKDKEQAAKQADRQLHIEQMA